MAEYTLLRCGIDYINGHLRRKGKSVAFAGSMVCRMTDFWGPDRNVETLRNADFEEYFDARIDGGVTPGTAYKDLTHITAAIRFAHKRERIAKLPVWDRPSIIHAKRRPLTEDEFRLVIAQPMSERLLRFYWCAYYTGSRSRAIEEWTWDRCDLDRDIAHFNVPGTRVTNKRRVDGFPICPEFKALLVEWKREAKDSHVIGLGKSGRCTSVYHAAHHVVRVKCGLTDSTLVPRHCMRSMFVTELVDRMIEQRGAADMEVVGALTGDNPDMLRKHYLSLRTDHMTKAAALRGASR